MQTSEYLLYALFLHYNCTVYMQEQLNYADLNIQRGPNRYGGGDHTVEYVQVAETEQ